MSRFLQLHFLTSYAPSNLNRDDLGRPKTALFGGTQRLRVSSQSLKRAWRKSDKFDSALKDHIGIRTKDFGNEVHAQLSKGLDKTKSDSIAKKIAAKFGVLKSKGDENALRQNETLVYFAPAEMKEMTELCDRLTTEQRDPSDEEINSLVAKATGAADIGLFGRMLAKDPGFNVEAAAQVAHAISVHKVAIEDDYFTAVDDLNTREVSGAAHVGTQEFASAVLYQYVCIDLALLAENLGNDGELMKKTVAAFAEACLTVAPCGKQNSFASRAFASFALAELGDYQPRSLAVAFIEPMKGENILSDAIIKLKETREKFEKVYEGTSAKHYQFDVTLGEGSLKELVKFAVQE